MSKFIAIIFLYLLCIAHCFADYSHDSSIWLNQSSSQNPSLNVEVFLSSTCPHCTKANQYMTVLAQELPWLKLHRYYVNTDTDALKFFYQRLSLVGDVNFAVPAIFFCGSHWMGFSNEGESGKELLRGLNYCHERVLSQAGLTVGTVRVLNAWSKADQWQSGIAAQSSPLVFLSYMALFDFVMPCSIFSFLLIFVWLGAERFHVLSMSITLFSTFLITHYIGQVHSEVYLEHLASLKLIALVFAFLWLVLIADWIFRVQKQGSTSVSIRFSRMLAIFSLTLVLAFQQVCPNNVSLVFQQWLNHQEISIKTYWIYQLLYQLISCLPLGLMMAAYAYFLRSKTMRNKQVNLWCFNLLMMVGTTVVLVFSPQLISKVWLPWTLAFAMVLLTILCRRFVPF